MNRSPKQSKTEPPSALPEAGEHTACDPSGVERWLLASFSDIVPKSQWGETSFFVNPGARAAHGAYFLTIKQKDGDNDKASALDRPGVWRLNFGLPKPDFVKIFGPPPRRPGKGGVIEGPWDFTKLDQLTPHPVYGWAGWVAILNPSLESLDGLKPLVARAHWKAIQTFRKRFPDA